MYKEHKYSPVICARMSAIPWTRVFQLIQYGQKNLCQLIIYLGLHKAETDEFIVQEGEGRAVSDHEALLYRSLEEIHRGDILP